ncbi:MAG: patatin-like phospholipase family protein [Methanosarcinaceae archaeon]
MKRKTIGLALGSGAARGLAHIGVLKILAANKIPVDFIAGTSMGALIGALYAGGLSVAQLEDIACNTDWKLTAKMLTPTLPWAGLVEGNRIREFIRTLVGDRNLSDLKIPFATVATAVQTGEEIVIENGSLVEAVRASISIPGVFTPVRYRNRFLVDGGVVNPLPVDVVKAMGADIVIAVNVTPPLDSSGQSITLPDETSKKRTQQALTSKILNTRLAKYVQDKVDFSVVVSAVESISEKKELLEKKFSGPNIIETIMQTINIMENEILRLKLQQSPPDILIEPEVGFVSLLDFHKAKELIETGEVAAAEKITLIEQLLK